MRNQCLIISIFILITASLCISTFHLGRMSKTCDRIHAPFREYALIWAEMGHNAALNGYSLTCVRMKIIELFE